MKPQERFFFMHVLFWCEYRQYYSNGLLYNVAENFSKVFAVPEKQLWYYVGKWFKKGFWNYGISLAGGWFEWEELTGEYKQIAHEFQLKERDGSPWTEGKKIKLEDVIKTEGKTWTSDTPQSETENGCKELKQTPITNIQRMRRLWEIGTPIANIGQSGEPNKSGLKE